MTGVTFAHIGGVPIEETLGFLGPALLLAAGAASARLSARARHLRAGGGINPQTSAHRRPRKELGTARQGETDSQTPTRSYDMATFAVIAEHPPELCPTSNAQTRKMLNDGAPHIPQLADQLGLEIITLRAFGPDHIILAVVEADDIESVREFVLQSRLIQWNTTTIHPTYSIDEVIAKSDTLEAIY
jgi:hypothetical protein